MRHKSYRNVHLVNVNFESFVICFVSEFESYASFGGLNVIINCISNSTCCLQRLMVHSLLDMLVQVADGMDYISKQETVHRDLRAANCL